MRIHYKVPHQLICNSTRLDNWPLHLDFRKSRIYWISPVGRVHNDSNTLRCGRLPKTKSYDWEHCWDDPWTLTVMMLRPLPWGACPRDWPLSAKNLFLMSHVNYQIICLSPLLFLSHISNWRCAGRYFYCETCDSWRAGEHWGIISQVNLPIEPVCSHTRTLQVYDFSQMYSPLIAALLHQKKFFCM